MPASFVYGEYKQDAILKKYISNLNYNTKTDLYKKNFWIYFKFLFK